VIQDPPESRGFSSFVGIYLMTSRANFIHFLSFEKASSTVYIHILVFYQLVYSILLILIGYLLVLGICAKLIFSIFLTQLSQKGRYIFFHESTLIGLCRVFSKHLNTNKQIIFFCMQVSQGPPAVTKAVDPMLSLRNHSLSIISELRKAFERRATANDVDVVLSAINKLGY